MKNFPEVTDPKLCASLAPLAQSVLWSRDEDGHLFTIIPPEKLTYSLNNADPSLLQVTPFPKDCPTPFRRITLLQEITGFKPPFREHVRSRQIALCNAQIDQENVVVYNVSGNRPVTTAYSFVNFTLPPPVASAFCAKLPERLQHIITNQNAYWKLPEMKLIPEAHAQADGQFTETVRFQYSGNQKNKAVSFCIPVCMLPAFLPAGALDYLEGRNIHITKELEAFGLNGSDEEATRKICRQRICPELSRPPEQLEFWANRVADAPSAKGWRLS